MKIVSWNVNGLRSLEQPLKTTLDSFDAEIVCFQESKITRDLLEEKLSIVDGYNSYFSFSRVKSGYSGVVTYCRDDVTPARAEDGLTGTQFSSSSSLLQGKDRILGDVVVSEQCSKADLLDLDKEGRCVVTEHMVRDGEHSLLTVFNVYCPFVSSEQAAEGRQEFSINFLNLLAHQARKLQKTRHVVICGDLNVSHQPIDHCDPDPLKEFGDRWNRKWLSALLNADSACHFVDTYRKLHAGVTGAFSCWNTETGARQTNYGTRIDYVLTDSLLTKKLTKAAVLQDYQGSDHCPVTADFQVTLGRSAKLPPLCSALYPEFRGKQLKITAFANAGSKRIQTHSELFEDEYAKQKKTKPKQGSLLGFLPMDSKYAKSPAVSAQESVQKHSLETPEVKTTGPGLSGQWKSLFKPQKEPPKCKGHGEACVLRTVKKSSSNVGRKFYVCARPAGHHTVAEASCSHFEWATKSPSNTKKKD